MKTRKQFIAWLEANREMKFIAAAYHCPLAKFYDTWVGFSMMGNEWMSPRMLKPWEFKIARIADNIWTKDGTFTGQDMLDAIARS